MSNLNINPETWRQRAGAVAEYVAPKLSEAQRASLDARFNAWFELAQEMLPMPTPRADQMRAGLTSALGCCEQLSLDFLCRLFYVDSPRDVIRALTEIAAAIEALARS